MGGLGAEVKLQTRWRCFVGAALYCTVGAYAYHKIWSYSCLKGCFGILMPSIFLG